MMLRKSITRGKKGQSVVETALVLPIIILLLMGIIDFGLLFSNYLVITNACREGAREAAVGYTDSEIVNAVISMSSTLDQSKLKVTVSPPELVRKKGDQVSVTVEYENMLLTPVISAIVPNPVLLKAVTVMRME